MASCCICRSTVVFIAEVFDTRRESMLIRTPSGEIWVYGNSFQSFAVDVVNPNKHALAGLKNMVL
ncbi:hypothetical protein SOVF_161770 isoform C [Spinacia oleracea]|nr:hypothetical protein SOVF_161770 isoform C [Spinacia oleracea]